MNQEKRILVVDDSRLIRGILREELEGGGYEVLEVESGEEAIKLLVREKIDLVTMDVQMPGLNGYEVCQQLRSDRMRNLLARHSDQELPVVFLTAKDSLTEREKGFSAGATDYLTKPCEKGAVLRLVNQILYPQKQFQGTRALFMSRDPATRIILRSILGKLGVDYYEVQDCERAMDIVKSRLDRPMQLILLDASDQIPEAQELCRYIRKNLNLVLSPIVVLVPVLLRESGLIFFKHGATEVMLKPFVQEDFEARLNRHLKAHQMQVELQKQIQALKELQAQKERFLRAFSHDLKNPLAGMIGFLEIMMSTPDLQEEEKKEYLHIINGLCYQVEDLLGDLLFFGRMGSASMQIVKDPIPLKSFLTRHLEHFRISSLKKHIFELKIPDPEPLFFADLSASNRILTNLLSNAVKFTPEGGKIEILVSESEKWTEISVRDSGIGIPKNLQSKLFKEYSEASRPGTEGESSTGLGLFIVQNLIKLQEGQITFESEENKGTCFILKFPRLIFQDSPEPQNRLNLQPDEAGKSKAGKENGG